jgi:hypothetical protein
MISLLGSLFGFGSSLIGPVLETWNKSSNQKHELAMLHAQAEVPAGLVLDHFLPPQLDQSDQKYNAKKIREPERNAQCPVGYAVATDSCGVAPRNPVLSPRRRRCVEVLPHCTARRSTTHWQATRSHRNPSIKSRQENPDSLLVWCFDRNATPWRRLRDWRVDYSRRD